MAAEWQAIAAGPDDARWGLDQALAGCTPPVLAYRPSFEALPFHQSPQVSTILQSKVSVVCRRGNYRLHGAPGDHTLLRKGWQPPGRDWGKGVQDMGSSGNKMPAITLPLYLPL